VLVTKLVDGGIRKNTKPKNKCLELERLEYETFSGTSLFHYKDCYLNHEGLLFDSHFKLISNHDEYAIIEKFHRNNNIKSTIKLFFKKIKSKKVKNTKKYVLAYDDRGINNIFHWVVDTIGRLIYLEGIEGYTILIPEAALKWDYVRETIKVLKGVVGVEVVPSNSMLKFDQIYVVSCSIYAPGCQNERILRKLKNKLLLNDERKHSYERVYLSRSKFGSRTVGNESEFISVLNKYDFKTIYPEDYSFNEMRKIMFNVKVLVGVHGSALTNMLFIEGHAKILCLKHVDGYPLLPYYWNGKYQSEFSDHYFYSMANTLGYDFYHFGCKHIESDSVLNINTNILVDIKTFEGELMSIVNE